jgi:hypothetical protein
MDCFLNSANHLGPAPHPPRVPRALVMEQEYWTKLENEIDITYVKLIGAGGFGEGDDEWGTRFCKYLHKYIKYPTISLRQSAISHLNALF